MFNLLIIYLLFFKDSVWGQKNSTSVSPLRKQMVYEYYFKCKCVVYYQCDNNYNIITTGEGIIDLRSGIDENNPLKNVPCVDSLYSCCRTKSGYPVDTQTPTTSSTTTDSTDLRGVSSEKLKCGQVRAPMDYRIPSEEEDSRELYSIVGEIPWIVAIFRKKRYEPGYDFKCAGSLILPNVVLTATHCIVSATANDIRIHAPKTTERPTIGVYPENEREVLKLIKHPKYYSGGLHNDIALIILKESYNFKIHKNLNTICLPQLNQTFHKYVCSAAGWGLRNDKPTEAMTRVYLPIVEDSQCQTLLRRKRPEFELHGSFMCAGGVAGSDTCDGDGGGPLMCKEENGHYVQAGIVSWGLHCGKADIPAVYTEVSVFKNWIINELKNNAINAQFS